MWNAVTIKFFLSNISNSHFASYLCIVRMGLISETLTHSVLFCLSLFLLLNLPCVSRFHHSLAVPPLSLFIISASSCIIDGHRHISHQLSLLIFNEWIIFILEWIPLFVLTTFISWITRIDSLYFPSWPLKHKTCHTPPHFLSLQLPFLFS